MSLWRVVWREMAHRKLNGALALAAVVVATACAVGGVAILRAHEERNLAKVRALDNEIRKITKNMGFNILILPKEQNLADFHADDFAAKTMPEEYVHRLANDQKIFTVNHLRPALVRKLEWTERKRRIVLMGVSAVVPLAHRDPKKPLAQPVPEGKMHVGSVLSRELDLAEGQKVVLLGETFEVGKVYPERGSKDDITVWVDLARAQKMLGQEGRINLIQALECNCGTIDRLAEVRRDVGRILGDEVQVLELHSKALARAEARNKVKAEGEASVKRQRRLAAMLIPGALGSAGVWVGLMFLTNARQRRAEIGVLRAIGWRSRQILGLFLAKAVFIGLLGGAAGCLAGFLGAFLLEGRETFLFDPVLLVVGMALAPLVAVLAAWLPALAAAQRDPAEVLQEE